MTNLKTLNASLPKELFHKHAKKAFKELAVAVGITDYDLRTNKGGTAVLGETTLHSDSIYIQTSESMGIMVRTCKGKKDYCGGSNNFIPYGQPEKLIQLVKYLLKKDN